MASRICCTEAEVQRCAISRRDNGFRDGARDSWKHASLSSHGFSGTRCSMSGWSALCPPKIRMLPCSEPLPPGTCQTARMAVALSPPAFGRTSRCMVA